MVRPGSSGNASAMATALPRCAIASVYAERFSACWPALRHHSSAVPLSPFSEVECQNFRLGLGDDRELLAQDIADVPVQQLPAALEQALVSRFLNQRMLEAVARFRRRPAAR